MPNYFLPSWGRLVATKPTQNQILKMADILKDMLHRNCPPAMRIRLHEN